MYCPKCQSDLTNDSNFCHNCGYKIMPDSLDEKEKKVIDKDTLRKNTYIGLAIGIPIFLIVLLISFINTRNRINITYTVTSASNDYIKRSSNQTVVETDNVYSGVDINSDKDAYDLIIKDSKAQKDSCPLDILSIEEEMISKFNITAVNLCEMDPSFAKELYNVIDRVYTMFPSVKGNITNITIGNMDSSMKSVIAYYQPLFPFAQSNNNSMVYKMRIVLNAKYFLNENLLRETTKQSSLSGHFPPNSTISSPVAHELGHYLSFYAMCKFYKIDKTLIFKTSDNDNLYTLIDNFSTSTFSKKMLDEAYELYISEGNKKIDFDEWRGEISQYALSKDDTGKYIYDETIAEAFHDVYLNNDNANTTSKYIVKVLRKYVEA